MCLFWACMTWLAAVLLCMIVAATLHHENWTRLFFVVAVPSLVYYAVMAGIFCLYMDAEIQQIKMASTRDMELCETGNSLSQ